jgi:hypothetical protein
LAHGMGVGSWLAEGHPCRTGNGANLRLSLCSTRVFLFATGSFVVTGGHTGPLGSSRLWCGSPSGDRTSIPPRAVASRPQYSLAPALGRVRGALWERSFPIGCDDGPFGASGGGPPPSMGGLTIAQLFRLHVTIGRTLPRGGQQTASALSLPARHLTELCRQPHTQAVRVRRPDAVPIMRGAKRTGEHGR